MGEGPRSEPPLPTGLVCAGLLLPQNQTPGKSPSGSYYGLKVYWSCTALTAYQLARLWTPCCCTTWTPILVDCCLFASQPFAHSDIILQTLDLIPSTRDRTCFNIRSKAAHLSWGTSYWSTFPIRRGKENRVSRLFVAFAVDIPACIFFCSE